MQPEERLTSDTMTDEFREEHAKIVRNVAVKHHKNAHLFSIDDIEQEIWLALMLRWKSVRTLSEGNVRAVADKSAISFCVKERNDWMYFQGAVLYSGDMVEKILSDDLYVELEWGVDVEGRLDLQTAMASISDSQRTALHRKFALKETLTSAERMACSRGIQALTTYLNQRIQLERADLEEASREV